MGELIDFGLVTYMWGADWDLPTLLANCTTAGVTGVELRVEHAHGVDVALSAAQREEVRNRFEEGRVALLGMGTNFEFHSPDPAELKKNLEGAKAFLKLSHDVGGERGEGEAESVAEGGAGGEDLGADWEGAGGIGGCGFGIWAGDPT
jgi:sugar phosphate isomerase/epimerase